MNQTSLLDWKFDLISKFKFALMIFDAQITFEQIADASFKGLKIKNYQIFGQWKSQKSRIHTFANCDKTNCLGSWSIEPQNLNFCKIIFLNINNCKKIPSIILDLNQPCTYLKVEGSNPGVSKNIFNWIQAVVVELSRASNL